MNFLSVIESVCGQLDQAGVRYALIGGFAMALRGIQRATANLDFIILMQDLDRCDAILSQHGYRRGFHSENVSHYTNGDPNWGRIDILHAFRSPSLSMLNRADRVELTPNVSIPVVQIEDIVGLKIQALVNDPIRATGDWSDIRLLVEVAAREKHALDWNLIGDYLEIFQMGHKRSQLKEWHDKVDI